jgi:hypothetical protein
VSAAQGAVSFLLLPAFALQAALPHASASAGDAAAAAAASSSSFLESLTTSTLTAALLAALALSAAPLLTPPPPPQKPQRRRRGAQPTRADDEDAAADAALIWSVAGVVSLIPFTNWVAWVGLALDASEKESDASSANEGARDPNPLVSARVRYFLFAALYAAPYLHSGLRVDALDVVALLVRLCPSSIWAHARARAHASILRHRFCDALHFASR